ncbi:Small subunit processome component [Gaertneriomyces sp. JEL0708]|nr:Small subunit processome component [Gaertneriomyces sp. JEL0708]
MRVKRAKNYKRHMGVYTHSFGFRQPYQVIVDGNFVAVSQKMKTPVTESLPKVLQGPCRPMTTACVLTELRSLGHDFRPAYHEASNLEIRRCPHAKHPVSATDCISSIIGEGNQHRYCVATQDTALRSALRRIAGTPLLYVSKSVLILEPPSTATEEKVQEMELQKTLPQKFEVSVLKKPVEAVEPPIVKKKPKAPNPLSVKKPKKLKGGEADNKTNEKRVKTNRKTHDSTTKEETTVSSSPEHSEVKDGCATNMEMIPQSVQTEKGSRKRPLTDDDIAEAQDDEVHVDNTATETAQERKKPKRKRHKKAKCAQDNTSTPSN